MFNEILNGGLGETASSSRSGTDATTTYTISTPSGTATNLTLEQYNQLKDALAKYDDAYGIAYSYDLTAPDWNKFTAANAQSIVDDYVIAAATSGKTSKSQSWANAVNTRYAQIVAAQPTAPQEPTTQQNAQTQPKVALPPSPPNVSNPPKEEKKEKSSLLLPGLILALGVIGAILLTSSSKKRR